MAKEDKSNSKIGQLLEQLQEESWQLELLISGFAIFLVAGSFETVQDFIMGIRVKSLGIRNGLQFLSIFTMVLLGSWFFLLTNLILHVFLRGFWISAIGLRYISGDVDFDTLNFTPKFDKYLRKKIPSFDLYIEKLEKICSVVFAFTFIIIFMIFSLGLFVAFTMFIDRVFLDPLEKMVGHGIHKTIGGITIATIGITAFLYFIDFITLGWIKRRKFFAKFYYPIYRFYSWITLSALYRPLYYNLIDDKFGRRVGYLLLPYVVIIISAVTLETTSWKYYPARSSTLVMESNHYTDLLKDDENIRDACIPSKFVSNDYLELFIPYYGNDDKLIEINCPDLHADKNVGTRATIIKIDRQKIQPSSVDSLLMCVSEINRISIDDSIYQNVKYHFYAHPNKEEHGLLTILDIKNFKRGEHRIKVEKQRMNNQDSMFWRDVANFPFWKE